MFRVTKEIHFCYGHRLLDYEGKCRHLHGHNGRLEITLEAEGTDHRGMVVDFTDIKRVVKGWVDEHLDHKMILCRDDPILPSLREIGEPFFLLDETPAAENIAKLVYRFTVDHGFPVVKVRLWESETSWAEFG